MHTGNNICVFDEQLVPLCGDGTRLQQLSDARVVAME